MSCARWVGIACFALWASTLSACGSGSGPLTGGGIGGSGKTSIKVGTNVATGGLTVGGITYDTNDANIRIGGFAAAAADLRPGHVALVRGTLLGSAGVADDVEVDEVVKGPLEGKIDENRLLVLGQTVLVDDRTIYGPGIAPASPDGLTVTELLEIWGFVIEPGVVFATRIEREDSLSEFRIVGSAKNVNGAAHTFDIGTQGVDHTSADVSELPGGQPAEGQVVRVRGEPSLGGGGEIVATEVDPFDLDDEPDNEETEIEGFVTAVLSLSEFELGGFLVRTDPGTSFEGGSPGEIVPGVQLKVDGSLEGGVVAARRIRFEASVRLEADVDSVVGGVITFVGLPGMNVTTNRLTEFSGEALVLAHVAPGDHVRIRGRAAGATLVVATKVNETQANDDLELQGPVDAFPPPADPTFSILGVGIDTTGLADGDFEGQDGIVIGRAAFFGLLVPGTLVKVQGKLIGSVPVLDDVEIEGEED